LFNISFKLETECPFIHIDLFDDFSMYESLKKLTTTKARTRLFEDYLVKNILTKDYLPDKIDMAYDRIIHSNGEIKIIDLLKQLEINPRAFRRAFVKRIGISAKELLRIVRVNHVWELRRSEELIDFNTIVYQCRFFDQSHFIKDFKKIIGETPKEFFNRELKQVKFISGSHF